MISQNLPSTRRFIFVCLRTFLWCAGGLLPALARAEPVDFNLPAQPAADALLAFSKQTKIEVLFSYDELYKVQSTALNGSYEPEVALVRLLDHTGFTARRNARGKFVITPVRPTTGSIRGRIVTPDGLAAREVRVAIPALRQATLTDRTGEFHFFAVPAGVYQITATATGYQPLLVNGVQVKANRELDLETQTMPVAGNVTQLEPFVVIGRAAKHGFFDHSRTDLPRTASGNIDLPRTQDDALPYAIYDRGQIARSGLVNLNDFLQRAVLDSDGRSPEQDLSSNILSGGSSNLNLRGYSPDQTIVLVNGRRLPEVLTSDSRTVSQDVNFIPLSLVQQVEVLPVSASAIYSGNAVGGVINIVLRSGADADTTEVTTTYTNALRGFDAPQTAVSFLHGQTLLNGKLHLLVSASLTDSVPPLETELKYLKAREATPVPPDQPIYRATPNIRSADQTPLFGDGTTTVTSVAPGADGSGGLAAFAGREGVRNYSLFASPGGMAASPNSSDYPYGRQQRRSAWFASGTYDLFPSLQLGLDATYVHTVVNRGYDVMNGDLTLSAASPFNPFKQDIKVSLNETAPQLGQNYSEAHIDFASIVVGALLRLPSSWQVSLDGQYSNNLTRYRGLAPVDTTRWQQLVDEGTYNPLRDTQVHPPPQQFYDQALVYYGARGKFVTLGNYDTYDAAVRISNPLLPLPTGPATINLGADYRLNHLAPFADVRRYGDGSLAEIPLNWTGRTLQHYSVFGELQAPLVPTRRLPRWMRKIEADLAVRYIAAASSKESNVAPTLAMKADFVGGFSLRGSVTTSNRFPTPSLSKLTGSGGPTGGIGSNTLVNVIDPLRGNAVTTNVVANEQLNPNLLAESAVTQTGGFVFQRGKIHRLRVSVDFVDTRKVNEQVALDAQGAINLEGLFPGRVNRAAPAPGDPYQAGVITSVLTGNVNLASRHSRNWNTSVDYTWTNCFGGNLELYGRWVWFQSYERQILPDSPPVNELTAPDGTAPELLKHRVNFGAGWSRPDYGFGIDGHYYSPRVLPENEWSTQRSRQIKDYWQFDAFAQRDLSRWLPWKTTRFGLRAQARVNNVFGYNYPKYANDVSGAGVQPYGDWRGRVYSLSLTATF